MEKTNVMRLLDVAKIEYVPHEYDNTAVNGEIIASLVGKSQDETFKTLVTVANTGEHYVFVVPVNCTLSLKKASKVASVKSIEMIKQKDLLPLTGYIHGGCSPVGMKKPFKTFFNDTAMLFDTICLSAGKVGYQVELKPDDIVNYVGGEYADITE